MSSGIFHAPWLISPATASLISIRSSLSSYFALPDITSNVLLSSLTPATLANSFSVTGIFDGSGVGDGFGDFVGLGVPDGLAVGSVTGAVVCFAACDGTAD